MGASEPKHRALHGLLVMSSALVAAGLAWIIAQTLDMHVAAGAVLCAGGALSALLNALATFVARRTLKETNGDRTGARCRALMTVVLCPLVLFLSVFVFESGRLVLAAHAR